MCKNKDCIAKLISEKTFSLTEIEVLTMTPGSNLDFLKNFNICNSYLSFSKISTKTTNYTLTLLLQKAINLYL